MAVYVIGAKDVTIGDIKDINPAPEQTVANHPLGNPYVRLGKANGQDGPALHFTAGSTVDLPNTSDVKESERGARGQRGDTHLILSNRSFDALDRVQKQVQGLSYEEMKPFSFSQGMDVRQKLSQSPLAECLADCRTEDLDIELTDNIGCSDASIVYNTVNPAIRKKLLPIIMGPGTRSQAHADPPRFTHGRNETFDQESGRQAMIYITDVLSRLKALRIP